MTKVCHFTSVHSATDGRIFWKECCSLAKAGYEVFLVAPNAGNEIKNGVQIIGVPLKMRNRFYRMFFFSKEVYKIALSLNAEIYHFHDPELLVYANCLKKKGKKVIFDSHEDVVNQILQKKYLSLFRYCIAWLYKIYEKRILSKIDAIISVTPHIVTRLRCINKNTYQITNYPLLEEKYENVRCDNQEIVFAGGISSLWLHENIIKALRYAPEEVKYTFAGPGSNKYLDKLKALDIDKRTNYLGILSRQKVMQLYRHAFLGIAMMDYVPNAGYRIGTLGNNKLFEFMNAGLPVICTDFILWKEIIDKWKCGIYVDAHDIHAIGMAINTLYSNPELARKMGENGMKAVMNEYNWSTQEKILLKLYKELQ